MSIFRSPLASFLLVFIIFLSYFIVNRNYYVKQWLILKPIHDNAARFFCNNFINCTDVCLLFANGEDRVFSTKMGIEGPYIYYKAFSSTEGKRKPVYVVSHWDHVLDPNADVIYVFVDGEPDGLEYFEDFYPKMLYIGHKKSVAKETANFFYLPYLVTSFIIRNYSPLFLTLPGTYEKKKYFAAYIASNCVPFRERAFDMLYEFAKKNNLGEVHSLGGCYGSYKDSQRRFEEKDTARGSSSFLISAARMLQDYKYGLTFENTMQDGYVTEKIVSPFFTNAIPIYYGSEAIFDIINADSFFYLKTLEDFEKLLTLENFTEEKRKKMVETPRIKESAYYYFSWHDDFAKILKANNSRTVPEDLADIVLNWK